MKPQKKIGTVIAIGVLLGMGGQVGMAADGNDYYVCYDQDGVPSVTTSDADLDGTPDCRDPDDDNDWLTDRLERALGFNAFSSDSDADGIRDAVDLAPTTPGKEIDIAVAVRSLRALDRCGDGNPWDPYFSTLVLNVPGKTVDYVFVGWTKDNHPQDHEGGFTTEAERPKVQTVVTTDATKWNLIQIPHPWTRSQAGMYDEDWLNSDDAVHLDGGSIDLVDDPLSLVSGTVGAAKSGTRPCRASISFETASGFDLMPIRIAQEAVIKGNRLIDCADIGMEASCTSSASGSKTIGAKLEPVTDGLVTPAELGDIVNDAQGPLPSSSQVQAAVVTVVAFADENVDEALVVTQEITGMAIGQTESLGRLVLEAGTGTIAAIGPAADEVIEVTFRLKEEADDTDAPDKPDAPDSPDASDVVAVIAIPVQELLDSDKSVVNVLLDKDDNGKLNVKELLLA